jgi:uncharacterized protein YcbK (DUF882 family)
MMIADYISRKEYECPCCHKLPPDLYRVDNLHPIVYDTLFEAFRQLRERWGKPIPITSAFRCPERNFIVGGERDSVHLFGLALDCDFDTADDVLDAVKIIERVNPNLRLGIYTGQKTFLHLDNGYMIFPRISELWRPGARWHG